jgi:uncharacterized membrane protein YjjP (DUF1212 family)
MEEPIEMALDVALIVMRNGGSTNIAERVFKNILKGYRQDNTSASWRLDVVTANRIADGRSTTVLRLVGAIGANLVRVSESVVLSERVARGEVTADALVSEIRRIEAIGSPYDRWVMIAAAVGVAGAFSQLCGGDGGSLAVSCLAVAIGQFFRSMMRAKGFSAVITTFICGAISACIAGAGLRLGLSQVTWVTLVSSVIYMAPGLPLINGFVDMESYDHLFIGLERIANAVFLFLVLAVDIAFVYTVVL